MILGRGEHVILHGVASLSNREDALSGVLIVSNARIVFEAGAGGPDARTICDFRLEQVWNVHAGSTKSFLQGTRDYLTLEAGHWRVVFEVANARGWANAIVQAKGNQTIPPARPVPPSTSPPAASGQVVVNIPAPSAPKVMMACRHCRNLYDVTLGRCDRCGAPPT